MKKILINLIVLVVALAAVEAGLWLSPIPDPYEKEKVSILYYFKPTTAPNRELHFYFEDSLPGFANYKKKASYITNNLGFRGTVDTQLKKEDGGFRVFAVGGSTTQSYVMDEGDDWPSLLNQHLNESGRQAYEVINTGQSGHSLSDHLHLIVQKLIHMQPDLFIVYAGANDIDKLLNSKDLYQIRLANARKAPVFRFFATEFQLGRRLHYLFKGYSHDEIHLTTSERKKARREILKLPMEDDIPQLNLDYSITNLRAIIGICQSLNIKLMVIGQAVSWDETNAELDDWHFMVNKRGKRFSERVLSQLNTDLNLKMKQVCEEMNIPYINAQHFLPPTAANFYDDMHLNFGGNQRMAKQVFDFLRNNPDLINTNKGLESLRP